METPVSDLHLGLQCAYSSYLLPNTLTLFGVLPVINLLSCDKNHSYMQMPLIHCSTFQNIASSFFINTFIQGSFELIKSEGKEGNAFLLNLKCYF